ncbi:hypothetical protein [Micromonospora ureilytica]|uniref:hypothetical protein n=1 Tax=Micromonospora ureilytica TaxID=709868 RepID=UPI00403A1BD4
MIVTGASWPGRRLGLRGPPGRLGRTDWDREKAEAYPGALRVVEFTIDTVVQIGRARSLRWELQ